MKQNSMIFRVGASYITPRSDQISFVDDTFVFGDAFRARMDPDGEWGWYLSGEWRPLDHWGLELSYVNGDDHTGGNADGYFSFVDVYDRFNTNDGRFRDLGEFQSEMSAANVKWYPMRPDCMVQPYIGLGINYTDFSDESFTAIRRSDLRDVGLRSKLNMGYSWGYTWQAGVDFNFGHDSAWLVNLSAVYVDSETDMQFSVYDDGTNPDTAGTFESYSGDYNYNPWTFNIGVGYKFSF
ncbi:OmpW family outer membrane protein [Microbulbifer sp. SAOS-129_SWC]|uniref:OmpW/AlkL family protein n=1 Tax=Microbulbifer sp. SAOS-129_SWC TaxID=3145235 RepID=UPI003216AAE3